MKVNEILSNGKITLSFEVFPPKTDAQFESVRQATIDVAALKPSYMSVTYCPFNMCSRNKGKYS